MKPNALGLLLRFIRGSSGTAQVAQTAQVSGLSRGWLAPEQKRPCLLTERATKVEGLEVNYQQTHHQFHNQRLIFCQNWSYRGKNSFFRAVKNAGFNEHSFPKLKSIIMVADTEAAARYSQRCLQGINQTESLKVRFLYTYSLPQLAKAMSRLLILHKTSKLVSYGVLVREMLHNVCCK